MDIIFKQKTLEEIICYWIELEYVQHKIDELVEYTDEVGEYYEHSDWMKNNQDGSGKKVMDVHILLEDAAEKNSEVLNDTECKLKLIIKAGIESGGGIFDKYKNMNITDDQLNELMLWLVEDFEDIYEYEISKQLENFMVVLDRCLTEMGK